MRAVGFDAGLVESLAREAPRGIARAALSFVEFEIHHSQVHHCPAIIAKPINRTVTRSYQSLGSTPFRILIDRARR